MKIFVSVFNWIDQSVQLDESDFNKVANRLKESGDIVSVDNIDGVLFITKMGNDFLFLNEAGKVIYPPS